MSCLTVVAPPPAFLKRAASDLLSMDPYVGGAVVVALRKAHLHLYVRAGPAASETLHMLDAAVREGHTHPYRDRLSRLEVLGRVHVARWHCNRRRRIRPRPRPTLSTFTHGLRIALGADIVSTGQVGKQQRLALRKPRYRAKTCSNVCSCRDTNGTSGLFMGA